MSVEKRRTAAVYGIIRELFEQGKTAIRPGDVNAVLRERNLPMGTWEVRAEFTRLEEAAVLACDPETGAWHLVEGSSLQGTG